LLSAFIAAFAGGCQQTVVQTRVNKLVRTVSDLYYEQILDNLAMSIARPDVLPYFGMPTQATHTNSRQIGANYTPMWDLIDTGGLLNPFIGRYFFDRQGAALQGGVNNAESFQLQPVTNPDRLLLMRAAFQRAAGRPDSAIPAVQDLFDYLTTSPYSYADAVHPGWYYKTTDWKEAWKAKKAGAYVGRYDGIYVYVPPENLGGLSDFTFAIMDIATVENDYFYRVKRPGEPPQTPGMTPGMPNPSMPDQGISPFPSIPAQPGPRPRQPFQIPFPAPPGIPTF
jgi:hypothetical protein